MRQILDIWHASRFTNQLISSLGFAYRGKCGSWRLRMRRYACRYVGWMTEWHGMDDGECRAIWTVISYVWATEPLSSRRERACMHRASISCYVLIMGLCFKCESYSSIPGNILCLFRENLMDRTACCSLTYDLLLSYHASESKPFLWISRKS